MQRAIKVIQQFPELPFYFSVRETPFNNGPIPDVLPFSLGVCESTGLIIQCPNKTVQNSLEFVYQNSNSFLTMPSDESSLTRWRGDEFIDVMLSNIEVKDKELLEIGCGTGYVLNRLQNAGAKVKGCEPSPVALTAQNRYGLDVSQTYFSPELYNGKFDVIIHQTVLEHIPDPVDFLFQTATSLKLGGWTFIAVPNCEIELNIGDPNMMVHEHWSYFTSASLIQLFHLVGFVSIKSFTTDKGVLYAWGQWQGKCGSDRKVDNNAVQIASRYSFKLRQAINKASDWLDEARLKQEHVGFYGACGGAANLFSLVNLGEVSISLFDGEPAKHGLYLPNCNLPILPPAEILNIVPAKILILPIYFTQAIMKYLRDEVKISSKIIIDSFGDMLKNTSEDL